MRFKYGKGTRCRRKPKIEQSQQEEIDRWNENFGPSKQHKLI